MVIARWNQLNVNRRMYSGMQVLQTVTLLKRGDDQNEGTVTAYTLFQCRPSKQYKEGQPLQGNWAVGSRVVWHIPVVELERHGIEYLNVLDRIVDKDNAFWQPESPQEIITKLILSHICLDCIKVNPPGNGN